MALKRSARHMWRVSRAGCVERWMDPLELDRDAIEAGAVPRAFHAALDRAGLPRSRFHDLRHSAATFALSQGFTLEDVKNLLGHSSIVVTSNTYGHVLEQRQREVARAMDAVLGG